MNGGNMLRRLIASMLGLMAGLVFLVSPASAALSLTVYHPAITAAGSYVAIKAKATPGAYCAIGITGVLSYGHQKYASSTGDISWRPRVPSSAAGGDHSVKVSCVKGGSRVTRYTTLIVTRTYTWEGVGENASFSTGNLRIPAATFTVTLEWETCCFNGYGGISAEWMNSAGRRDYFEVIKVGPGSQTRLTRTFTSSHGNTMGWFNVNAGSDGNYGFGWRMTATGIAQ
jgi:hypothetical protein